MIETLIRHGDRHALLIDQALMDQLGITPDTPLQLVVSNGSLVVTPVERAGAATELRNVMAEVFERHDGAFDALAK
jgi:antitoxin component of MazEF toxin-antitoxin module